jgi:hypothetical protein
MSHAEVTPRHCVLTKTRYNQLKELFKDVIQDVEKEAALLRRFNEIMKISDDTSMYSAYHRSYYLQNKEKLNRQRTEARRKTDCANHMCESRGYEQYRSYCIRCFAHLYPEEPITKRHKTKESSVIHFLKEAFPDRPWVFDRKVDNGCSRYRPDIFLDLLTHSLIVEVDENQHDSYDCECENKRLMALFQDLGSRPLVLIRFNPDEYTKASGKRMKSCFVYRNVNGLPSIRSPEYWESRLETLRSRIQHYLQVLPDREVTVEHLYYDGFH